MPAADQRAAADRAGRAVEHSSPLRGSPSIPLDRVCGLPELQRALAKLTAQLADLIVREPGVHLILPHDCRAATSVEILPRYRPPPPGHPKPILSGRYNAAGMSCRTPLLFVAVALSAAAGAAERRQAAWPTFQDASVLARVSFQHHASPTTEKYLLETMGSGVAVFDADGDGLLDIYLVNGAPLDVAGAKGAVPRKPSSEYWNRLFVQRDGNQFVDVTEKSGVAGEYYGMGAAVADYDNDGDQDLTSLPIRGTSCTATTETGPSPTSPTRVASPRPDGRRVRHSWTSTTTDASI